MATLVGIAGPLYQLSAGPRRDDEVLFFASVTALRALILLVSLGLLRRTRLRLVRRENSPPAA